MRFKDILALSYRTIRSNKLRTGITVAIIALGIGALIMIITGIEAATDSLTSSFSTMGANAFSIRFRERTVRFGGNRQSDVKKVSRAALRERKSNTGRLITFEEARTFKARYAFPAAVCIAVGGPNGIVLNTDTRKTNPDIRMVGGDENYLKLNGYEIGYGRNFSEAEVNNARSICILGSAVANKLFPDAPEKAVDRIIKVDHIPYRVIGVMKDKGASAFFNADKVVVTTINNVRKIYDVSNASFNISVMVNDLRLMDVAVGEAKGTFRPIRKLDVREEDNFYIDKSDSIASKLITNLGFLKYATLAIAFITLIGAAIGLMNIMLVAVNERTREIGLIKALGGRKDTIRSQFLWESVLISFYGAIAGIIFGLVFGNVVALILKSGFVFPVGWVITAIFMCTGVGILAGLYPAQKAARLNPIEALRHE
jgi:putative ABC transport system permease protein